MDQAGTTLRPAYLAYHGLWRILDYLYPPACIGCGRVGRHWCPDCVAQARRIQFPVCHICGEPIALPGTCRKCREVRPAFEALRSYAEFEGAIRVGLHGLKYRQNISMGEVFTRPLAALVRELGWTADLVVPVPLSRERSKERGYNQAALIALPVALALGIHYAPESIQRTRDTVSQIHLHISERRQNVQGAFTASPAVHKKTVLVIDDVATNGSTISACAEALLGAGATRVLGLTLARAVKRNPDSQ